LPSSPPKIDGDQGQLLQDYFVWQIQRNESQREVLEQALTTLKGQCYGLDDIHSFTSEEWKEFDIPKGLVRRLRKELKTYRGELKQVSERGHIEDGLDLLAYAAETLPSRGG